MLPRAGETPQSLGRDEYEVLRAEFRPQRIKVLFIGESRPVNGTFFYLGDSRLARYTREAMGDERGSLYTFLKRFQSLGCYLLDLCSEPVNGLAPTERRNARKHGVQTLGEEATRYSAICDHCGHEGNSGIRHASIAPGRP
jgi:hypothetical protein